jgi:hypothetical protein
MRGMGLKHQSTNQYRVQKDRRRDNPLMILSTQSSLPNAALLAYPINLPHKPTSSKHNKGIKHTFRPHRPQCEERDEHELRGRVEVAGRQEGGDVVGRGGLRGIF